MTLPIPPAVFADGSLLTEAGFYANVLTPINTLYAQLQTLLQVDGLQRGSIDGTVTTSSNNAFGTVTFPNVFGGIPNVSLGLLAAGQLDAKITSLSASQFTWSVFYTVSSANSPGNFAFTLHWIAIG